MNKIDRKTNSNVSFDNNDNVDVIVLGVGTCGEDLSLHLLDAGLKVVGIEAALVGGGGTDYRLLPVLRSDVSRGGGATDHCL